MANSNSEHSKKQRLQTSAKWNKVNNKTLGFSLNKNNPKHIEAIEIIDSMPQKTNVDKLLFLVDLYKKSC